MRWALLSMLSFPLLAALLYTFRFEQITHPVLTLLATLVLSGLVFAKREAIAGALGSLPERRALWGIFGLALFLRLLWVAVSHTEPRSDFKGYLDLGEHLARYGEYAYGGHLSNRRPPGMPLVLALFYELGLDPVKSGQIVNALASSAAVFPVSRWAFAWTKDQVTAIFACILWALLPSEIFFCSILATEPLFALSTAWIAALMIEGRRIAAGLLAGIATYVRSQGIIVPFAIAVFDVLAAPRPERTRRVRAHALTMAVAFACLLPWGIRNQLAFGKFTLLTLGGGVSAYIGNNPIADGRHIQAEDLPERIDDRSEIEQDRIGYRRAFEWIAAHPIAFALLIPKKWAHLFKSEHDAVFWSHTDVAWERRLPYSHAATQAYYAAVLLLAVVGVFRRRRAAPPNRAEIAATAILFFWFLQHAFFHAQPRYHAALDPIFCMAAALVLPVREAIREGEPSCASSG